MASLISNLNRMNKQCKVSQALTLRKTQLFVALSLVAVFVTACNSQPGDKNLSSKDTLVSSNLGTMETFTFDSTVLFLLEVSAKDFYDHQPPIPVDFRNVEIRILTDQNSDSIYLLCGQFLALDKKSKEEWTYFATIKTDPYEQWIGANALTYYQNSEAISNKNMDLSSALQKRMDALQNTKNRSK